MNVEQKALTDPRFDLLGRFLESNRHEALGRMILVWAECLERSSYTLPERLVGAILGNRDGAQWLVESDLATWHSRSTKKAEGSLRIRGTEGRIEWLATKRKVAMINGKKGGRPHNQPETDIGSSTVTAGNLQPPALTLTLTPAPETKEEKTPLPPAKPGGETASDDSPKTEEPPKQKKPRPRNPLFDALAEVTGADPTITSQGRTLGTKSAELAKASPPYTPDDVREFGRRFHELCKWAREEGRDRPTPGEVVKWISQIRAKPVKQESAPKSDPLQGHEPMDFEKLRKQK